MKFLKTKPNQIGIGLTMCKIVYFRLSNVFCFSQIWNLLEKLQFKMRNIGIWWWRIIGIVTLAFVLKYCAHAHIEEIGDCQNISRKYFYDIVQICFQSKIWMFLATLALTDWVSEWHFWILAKRETFENWEPLDSQKNDIVMSFLQFCIFFHIKIVQCLFCFLCSFQFVKKWGFVGPKTAAPPNGHKDRLGLAETTHLWDILCNAHSEIESNVGCLGIGWSAPHPLKTFTFLWSLSRIV